MFETFLTKLGTGILAIALSVSTLIGGQAPINNIVEPIVQEQSFGAAPQFVGGKPYFLSGSGIASSDTSIPLASFTLPVDNREIVTADLVGGVSDKFYITIEPNNNTKKEFVSCTGVTQSPSTVAATLTGCTRGLQFTTPYTASSSLRQSHGGGSRVVLSDPPQLYQSIIDYINNATSSGAVDASVTAKGIVEVATGAEAAATAAVGTGNTSAALALTTTISTSTKPASGNYVVVTDTSGGIGNFISSSTITSLTLSGISNIGSTTIRTYTATTTAADAVYTWTKPSNLKFVRVRAVGGGAAGGGTTSGGTYRSGGGGGGGSYSEGVFAASALSSTVSITVGHGGIGGTGNGGNAATSSFGSFIIAGGGFGGSGDTGVGSGGGNGTSTAGQILLSGESGTNAICNNTATICVGGIGGGSILGGGSSNNYGSGGNGVGSISATNAAGASGSGGYVIVEEVYF